MELDQQKSSLEDNSPALLPNGTRSWLSRQARPRQLLRLAIAMLVVVSLSYYMVYGIPSWPRSFSIVTAQQPTISVNRTSFLPSALPHVPSKIWQIYLAFTSDAVKPQTIVSFITHSPSYTYSILDKVGANALVDYVAANYEGYERIRPLYDAMSRVVIRADFLRFLALAVEGGVYADTDTTMLRPLIDWVPAEFRDRTQLVVGIEADAGGWIHLVGGTSYPVQFCQWTMAAAPGHRALWAMVDRILDRVADKVASGKKESTGKVGYSNADVLAIGGPAGWTQVVYEHLSHVTGRVVSWEELTGIREPKFFGDTLVLPIDGFATGVPHSGATYPGSNYTEDAMVLHHFSGSWKSGSRHPEE